MEIQEAVERLKCMRLFMQIEDDKNECKFLEDDYIANDMAIKALEKQIPKKPKGIDSDICPNCSTYNSVIPQRRNAVGSDTIYCWHCGKAIEI